MKKMIRIITLLILAAILTMTAALPTLAKGVGLETANNEYFEDFENHWDDMQDRQDTMEKVLVVFLVVVFLLLIAEIVYILIEAPKCGMSRFWALVPLFSNLLGLIVFIVVRSSMKNNAGSRHTVVCPTCNGVHPLGTAHCSICGTKLQ